MTREQTINYLHSLVADPQKGKTKSLTFAPYEQCSAADGYKMSADYFIWAIEIEGKSKDQKTFWVRNADKVVSQILMHCFRYYTMHGFDWPDQPPFPDTSQCSPGLRLFKLEQYAEKLGTLVS